ncbi:hypothetical protein BH10BAC2_BH10BAC2_32770 [soil metagenome]
MNVYFFSGLGADKTVFQFLDLSFCNPVFIEWITPLKNEALESYALRLKEHYQIPDNAIIAGLSFGGMLATELAKKYPALRVIIISSAKTKYELPRFYQLGKYITMHSWTPAVLQRWFMLNTKMLFSLKTPEYIKVYEELIKRSDTNFNKWAVGALLHWGNTMIPSNIKHIHGTHDKILPYKYVSCNYTVNGGGHLMVMEQAAITSKLILDIIVNEAATLSSSASQPAHLLRG